MSHERPEAASRRHAIRPRLGAGFAALVLSSSAVALTACGSDGGGSADALPSVDLVALADGTARSTADIEGPAVVNLWATWCGPCRQELPAFQQVHEELGDQVRFVGVNQADSAEAVSEYLAEVGVDFEQLLDEDGALSDELSVTGLPATAFVAADGSVVEVHQGELTADELRELIATDLLDPGATGATG